MDKLIEIGFDEKEIQSMMELNPYVIEENDIAILIDILSILNCNQEEIKNIVITNPLYLSRDKEDTSPCSSAPRPGAR